MSSADRAEIRELVEAWALWRDSFDWDRFRTVWHPDGRMMATWCQAPFEDFIDASQRAFEGGALIQHLLGGCVVDVEDDRAIAQTKMTINQRAEVDGVLVDVVCMGRFYDFFERREGRWGLVLRQPIYEKDRLDPVAPDARLELDRNILDGFPQGYRHLAYLQVRIGYDVKRDMPGISGPEIETLYADGAAWLAGETLLR